MNPVLQTQSPKLQKAVLKAEARARAAGDWGEWDDVPRSQWPFRHATEGWLSKNDRVHRNKVFCVLERYMLFQTPSAHLAVSSLSGVRPTFHEMQRIKNELLGPEIIAVEIYPMQDDLVDAADMFHLWVIPATLKDHFSKLLNK